MAKHFSPDTTEQEEALFQGKIMDEYAASRVGHQFGNYRLLRLLGQGGFADVYLGEHLYLKTHAALKVLRLQLTNNALEDFLHEARTIARLEHPHIVRVLECGVERGTPFLVMNYAPNGTLRQHYARGSRLPLAVVVSYVQQIASALDYAHHAKLIHRDVKPENMLLGRAKEVLLSDFGLVLIAQSSRSQTMKEMAGTIPYMAPEQLQGKPRPASDQYALGIVVYEWLAGERPFQGTFAEIASQHLLTPPPSLHQRLPDIPPALENVVLKALAKDSQGRFASVQEFALALEQAIPTVQRPLIKAPLTPPPPSIVLQSTDEMDLAGSPSVSFPTISTSLPMDGSAQPLSTVTSSGTHQPLTDTASFWTQSLQPMSTIAPPSLSSQPTMSIPVDSSLSTRILTPSDQSTIQVGPSLLSNPSLVDSPSLKSEPASYTPLPGAFTPEHKPKRWGSAKARAIGAIVLALVVILGSVGLLYHPTITAVLPGTTPGVTGNISQTAVVSPLPIQTATGVNHSLTPSTQTPIPSQTPGRTSTYTPTPSPTQVPPTLTVRSTSFVNKFSTCTYDTHGGYAANLNCSLVLSNTSQTTMALNWSASMNPPYYTISPNSGTIPPGQSVTISFYYYNSAACPGGETLTIRGSVNTVQIPIACTFVDTTPDSEYFDNTHCTKNGNWTCIITLIAPTQNLITTSWVGVVQTLTPGITISPNQGTLAPGASIQVTITIASTDCPGTNTFSFYAPGALPNPSSMLQWSC